MFKKLLQLKTLLILALLAMVGNSAWAQSTSTLTFSAKCAGSGIADDGVSWTVTSDGSESNFDNSKGIHYGTSSLEVQYIKLSTSQIVGTITSVVVNASTASGVSATVDVTVGGVAFGDNPQSLSTSAKNYTFNGSASGEIVVTVTKPSKAAKALYVKSVAVTYTSGGTSTLTDNDLALTGAPVELSFDLYNNATPQVIHYTTSSTGAVTIADNDYATFAVDQANKTITVTPTAGTPSTQTITVNQAADDTYAAGSVTFKLDVDDSTPSSENWVETALADLTSTDIFVIVGKNSQGNTYAMSNDNGTGSAPSAVSVTVTDDEITSKVTDAIKWNISGDATNGYTFYPAGSTDPWLYCTNTNNGVRVGNGEAKHFTLSKNGYLTTTETTEQRYLGIYDQTDWRCYKSEGGNIADQTFKFFRLVDSTLPRLTVLDVNVDLDYNATSGSISYTLVNPVSGGEVTAKSSENWLTLGTVKATEVPFTCTANEANTERTATVTLTYTYGDNETVTKDVTVTQAEYVVIKTYSIATSITSGKHYIITNGSAKAMGTQASNNRNAVGVTINNNVVSVANSDVTEFVIYGPDANGYYTIFDGNGYLYAASSSNNYLKTETTLDSDNHGLWKITFSEAGASIVADKSTNRNVMQFNSGSDLFSCYAGATQSAVSLYEKDGEDIPTENKTLNDYGYATYCSQNALDFSDDSEVTAWAISEANSTTGVITFTQITGKAAAGTGMLLKGEANASVTLTSASGKDDLTNLLIGTTKAHTVLNNGDYYGLSGNTFVPVNAGTVPAGKALLPSDRLTSGSGSPCIHFRVR